MAKKPEVKKELIPATPQKELIGFGENEAAWGAAQDVDAQDILIPKILLQQSMSEACNDGKAKPGDYIENLENKVIGSREETPIEAVIFASFKTLEVGKNGDWEKTIPYLPEHAALPYEEMVGADHITRAPVLNFYCLRVQDIASGMPFPYLISFRRTNQKAGKKLHTIFTKLRLYKKPSAAVVISITAKPQENDKGKWFVSEVAELRASTAAEVAAAKEWAALIGKRTIRIIESGEEETPQASAAPKKPVDDKIPF